VYPKENSDSHFSIMLADSFDRIHDYLRISVTERCNLRCSYCMPEHGVDLKPKETLLTYEEIARIASIFVKLGVRKIRLTGGEPLVRKNLEELCAMLSALPGLNELALSTNGLLLEEKLPQLWNSGVRQLNISLDTLQPDRFERLTRRANFLEVIAAIRAAAAYQSPNKQGGFDSIKINAVVIRGTNDDELIDFVRFVEELNQIAELAANTALAAAPSIEMRFIEFMPFRSNGWDASDCVPYREMRETLESVFHLEAAEHRSGVAGPAKSFMVRETAARVGFITSISEHFCGDCNRLRLTADGSMRVCLFGTDTISLRDMLRSGASEADMEVAIRRTLYAKWEKHPEPEQLIQINDREMVMIGG
jgi:cyclic pyranopterin phosphate synthase